MRRSKAPALRLSDKDRLIVSYIVRQLEMAYRNSSGKPTYAKNMDQVFRDLFGIKKFTKTLEKARHNEGLMIELMKALDTETLWRITRSKEHYRMLCTLVAVDHEIVRMGKKLNAMADMDISERPTQKMRKLIKQIKKNKKMYKACINTLQDIFNIEKVGKKGGGMLSFMEDWLDRNEGDGDLFYGDTWSIDESAIESMDDYIDSISRKRRQRRSNNGSVLDLNFGGESTFMDDDEDDDLYMDDDYDDRDDEQNVLAYVKKLLDEKELGNRRPPRNSSHHDDDYDDIRDDMRGMAKIISAGFDRMANSIDNLYGLLTEPEDGDDGDASTISEMMNMTEQYNAQKKGDATFQPIEEQVVNTQRPVPADEIIAEGDTTPNQ